MMLRMFCFKGKPFSSIIFPINIRRNVCSASNWDSLTALCLQENRPGAVN